MTFQLTFYTTAWTEYVRNHPNVLKVSESPKANDEPIRNHPTFKVLFSTKVPDSVPGFECVDTTKMTELYPAGIAAAREVSVFQLPTSTLSNC